MYNLSQFPHYLATLGSDLSYSSSFVFVLISRFSVTGFEKFLCILCMIMKIKIQSNFELLKSKGLS